MNVRRAVLAFAVAAPLVAQSPYTEKIEVSVVNVDVAVTDRHGKPVRGLTQDQFEVFEDGVQQPVTGFYAVEGSAADTHVAGERFRRKVLVVIDTFSTTVYARDQAMRRLEEMIDDRFRGGESDWSIAALDTELRVLLPPTSDKAAIHRALDAIRANHVPPLMRDELRPPPATPLDRWAAAVQDATDARATVDHVDAILDAIRSFSATSGKKVILFVTRRLLPDGTVTSFNALRVEKSLTLLRNAVIREANASNVNLYIVNPEGVGTGDPSMYWVARETGGRLMPGNRIDESLHSFDTVSSNFYSLGYRAPHPADRKYHRIEVRLKTGDYRLQYRNGYAGFNDETQLDRTMKTPFGPFMIDSSSIPVTLTFDRRKIEDGVIATIHATVPADKLVFLPSDDGKVGHVDIAISVFDAAGRNVWFGSFPRTAILGKDEEVSGTFAEHREVQLKTGQPYRVVVAIRDEVTDAVGAAQEVVQF